MRKKILVPLAAVLAFIFLTAESCTEENQAPVADSDSSSVYKEGSTIPVDDNVYTIRGEVVADVNSTTRQVKPAEGSLTGFNGYTSGSYFGPVEKGKGYVRLRVQTASPDTDEAKEGEVSILKVSDTKGTALLPGDIVTFKCRRQYEALAAVRDNSSFDREKVQTWELDFCRLASPVIDVK